jgi:hypothetical protein
MVPKCWKSSSCVTMGTSGAIAIPAIQESFTGIRRAPSRNASRSLAQAFATSTSIGIGSSDSAAAEDEIFEVALALIATL